ncbi:hypothetical protein [Clavibacter michiganensis]|nr:hypothetical protein [Clavibacter michiganensis]
MLNRALAWGRWVASRALGSAVIYVVVETVKRSDLIQVVLDRL